MTRRRRAAAGLLLLLLAACLGTEGTAPAPDAPSPGARPTRRATGPRLPPFSGGDPGARGWVKVDGLLWMEPAADGGAPRPPAEGLPAGTAPEAGLLLRTDHVAVRTNLPFAEGAGIARRAEDHVVALMAAYGEALDLWLPEGPLPVVACARRAEFEARLAGRAPEGAAWGAFYDSGRGAVYVSAEPAPAGALPLAADLRHEMTHQVLDLSTPSVGRAAIFAGNGHWLWEGFAVHAEGLGDPPGGGAGDVRLARFARRRDAGDVTPLRRLFALDQGTFEGRHYDQTASLMRHLLGAEGPRGREAVLATLRDLLRGRAEPGAFERRLGLSPEALEARWLLAGS